MLINIKAATLLIVILLTFSFTTEIFAYILPSEFEVKGIVTDSVSGKGIAYVTITIQKEQGVVKRLAADVSGKFDVILNSPGKFDMIFHSVGYQMVKTSVSFDENITKVDLGTVRMAVSDEKIDKVTVVAAKPLVRTEVDKIIYSMETDPESKTSNALEMLRKVPMVTVDGEDNIQVRGSSSFKILLNGKNSSMLSQNPKDVLRSLPASTIRDIEVITNPSSKYDAEGTAGIINIITTKKQLDGFMGNVNAGADSRGGYSGGLYATSKVKKFGFSMNYNYNEMRRPASESFSDRENFLSTANRFSESDGQYKNYGRYRMMMGEASYEIDTLNLISLSFWGYGGNFNGTGTNETRDFDVDRNMTRHFENISKSHNEFGSLSGNIDYQRSFKKPDKTFTISYKLDNSPQKTYSENQIQRILNYTSYRQKTYNEATGREHTFQLDYYDPLSKIHQIESGVKYILRQNVSNSDIFLWDDLVKGWVRDPTRINDLDYDQHIIAGYGGYVLKVKKISFKAGLRAEGTINDGLFSSLKDTTFTNKMFNVVPYITLSKTLEKGQNLKLSYTQRLSRPGIYYLNPFYNDIDPLNIRYGNPRLDSEIAHTFDFSYGKFSQKYNVNLGLNYAVTNNSITSITTVQPNGVSISTYENIGKNQRYGGYIYGSVKIGKKININTNLGMNYSILEGNDSRGLKNKGLSYNGYMYARYNPWNNGTFSGNLGIFSSGITLQGHSSNYCFSSLSYSQQLLKKKMSLSLSVSDPFRKRMKYEMNYDDPTFRQISGSLNYTRQLRLNISYRFGQMKDQIKKAKRSINNDDVKSGSDSGKKGERPEPNHKEQSLKEL